VVKNLHLQVPAIDGLRLQEINEINSGIQWVPEMPPVKGLLRPPTQSITNSSTNLLNNLEAGTGLFQRKGCQVQADNYLRHQEDTWTET